MKLGSHWPPGGEVAPGSNAALYLSHHGLLAAVSVVHERQAAQGVISLKSTFFPGDKVSMEWTDQGSGGSWSTTADVPLDSSKNTKVSFNRDWDY